VACASRAAGPLQVRLSRHSPEGLTASTKAGDQGMQGHVGEDVRPVQRSAGRRGEVFRQRLQIDLTGTAIGADHSTWRGGAGRMAGLTRTTILTVQAGVLL